MLSHEQLITRIRGEFYEMPGLRLTVPQASRLWDVDRETCETLLNSLVESRVLFLTPEGRYGAWPTPRRQAPIAAGLNQSRRISA